MRGYFCWARYYGLMLVNPMASCDEPVRDWADRNQFKQMLSLFSTTDKVRITIEELNQTGGKDPQPKKENG